MSRIGQYWVLDAEKRPIRVNSIEEWGRQFQTTDRVVKQEMVGNIRISTVFLGIDHGWGAPLLFETMVFGGEHDQFQDRCSTWKQAEAMHEKACALVRGRNG